MINKIKLYKPTIVWSKLNDHGSCGCEKCCWGPTASDGSSRVPLVFGCVPRMGGGGELATMRGTSTSTSSCHTEGHNVGLTNTLSQR